ncbi:hypothetical protein [Microbacterium gilvum]|uniref:Sugar ABC transporter ATPase n=1 Tax=Microbacterium gilvum TaxID=1336204 RepID=A0ABP9ART9_9MICO
MANVEGVDPDIQTRPARVPEHRDVPDDATIDALEDEVDPEELADDRGPLPDGAARRPALPDDERAADDGYTGEEDALRGDDEDAR